MRAARQIVGPGSAPGPPPDPEPTASGRLVGRAAPRFRVQTTPLLGGRSS
uniref:Uncharacterized protein n=1 Tax=Setaria italica TaxID=4555 RepID=K4A4L3_SETIT